MSKLEDWLRLEEQASKCAESYHRGRADGLGDVLRMLGRLATAESSGESPRGVRNIVKQMTAENDAPR